MRFRISFILIKISIFLGLLEGDLASALSDSHVVDIFTAPPPPSPPPTPPPNHCQKRASYGSANTHNI